MHFSLKACHLLLACLIAFLADLVESPVSVLVLFLETAASHQRYLATLEKNKRDIMYAIYLHDKIDPEERRGYKVRSNGYE